VTAANAALDERKKKEEEEKRKRLVEQNIGQSMVSWTHEEFVKPH